MHSFKQKKNLSIGILKHCIFILEKFSQGITEVKQHNEQNQNINKCKHMVLEDLQENNILMDATLTR